jgi:hypothetical protein
MTKLNSLARARIIGPKGGAEDSAADTGVGEGAAGVDVLVVSSSIMFLVHNLGIKNLSGFKKVNTYIAHKWIHL